MRILAFARRDDAGAVRADKAGLAVLHGTLYLHHVTHWNSFRDGNHQFQPGAHPFEDGIRGECGRNKYCAGFGARLFHRLGHSVEDGNLLPAVVKGLAAFAGRDSGDDLRPVVDGKLGVTRAEAAGDALNDNLGVGFDENGHWNSAIEVQGVSSQ